ncbi:sarcosine oxidase subunit alpha family protein [Sphingosinicella rhizophila]|uniref:Sarcosine oxidase subunit alpha family protein n=1 Tax=Sphingosinicella rhizophila TaxID=3050082 RepID=A0ABU3QB32_9SPHN|nr:sarcosine oxidase subunit alpha family protein [Sphingosinicella sp. GR2756]MDT9600223.1 sarcosine oxidase subunit alpha family protein [Sphingosinicella sp. GR2756]
MSGTQPFRLGTGGSIDRSRPIRFTFEGRTLTGFAGDTLASALLANGVRLAGRSFKYHRPRGLVGAGVEESNVLVQLGEGARSTPNVQATQIPLYDGLVAKPVNCWPSSNFDIGGVNNLLSRFFSAGFYYKTFMWPTWHLYEGFIRRAAGLGKVSEQADPDRYESRFAHCDLLVVGAGPAGLAAARAAAASGARVILAEQDEAVGGALLWNQAEIDGKPGADWAQAAAAEIEAAPEARILLRTTVTGYHDHNSITMVERLNDEAVCAAEPAAARARGWVVRAKQVVLATGALERPLVFAGNDRPGVMLAGAVRHYLARYGVMAGRRAIVATNNDDAYRTAVALHDAGVEVAAVVDSRGAPGGSLAADLAARSIPHFAGGHIEETRGAKAVKAAFVRGADGQGRWIDCDLVAMSGGYNPTVHLFSQSAGKLRFDEALAAFVPDVSVQAERSAGACNGAYATAGAIAQGHEAGIAAAREAGFTASVKAPKAGVETAEAAIGPGWRETRAKGKAFVDFQNDVTVDDIALSARENFVSIEHLKRYTTLGMAPDQGKTSNVSALAIMAALTGRTIEETGHTRYRFPYTPQPFGVMAGRNRGDLHRPFRRMPCHAIHQALGATFEEYGGWLRPAYYGRAGETPHQAEQREALAVRQSVGIFEGSPLGKIEVKGPDASRFLDLFYANTMSTLKIGKVRYGLMLNEMGIVIDDGVAARLGEDHFLVGTTSGGADNIAAAMEEWLQCEWLDLQVTVSPVSTSWGVVTLSGPRARDVMRAAGTDVDLDGAVFPHMSFVNGRVAGIDARIFRVSYTGDTSYEINVPTRETAALWQKLTEAGKGLGLGMTPIGIDAWMLLRTEKGYLHIGADSDGTTNAIDLGWGHVLKKKVDFIGKRSLLREADQRPDRLQFVGLNIADGEPALPIGAHLVVDKDGREISEGYVTSSGYSPTLGKGVALGMVRGGRARKGEKVRIRTEQGLRDAVIADPGLFDLAGERLND